VRSLPALRVPGRHCGNIGQLDLRLVEPAIAIEPISWRPRILRILAGPRVWIPFAAKSSVSAVAPRVPRLFVLIIAATLLASCAAHGNIGDYIPHWAGGLPWRYTASPRHPGVRRLSTKAGSAGTTAVDDRQRAGIFVEKCLTLHPCGWIHKRNRGAVLSADSRYLACERV